MVAHDPAELAHGDLPVVVRVKQGEGLLQAVQLGVGQLGRVARREGLRSGERVRRSVTAFKPDPQQRVK